MKASHIQRIICLILFLLWVYPVWAEDWIYYDTANVGDMYYDKSRVREVNKNVIAVWTKNILSEKAKTKYFSILQSVGKAPAKPSELNYYEELLEIDYANRRIKNVAVIFYNQSGRIIYASPKSETGEWRPIEPRSVGDKLSNLVSWEPASPGDKADASGVEDSGNQKKTATATVPVPVQKPAPDKDMPNKSKAVATADIRKVEPRQTDTGKTPRTAPLINPDLSDFDIIKSRPVAADPAPRTPAVREIGRDGHFIAYEDQTVVDMRTKLMWAAKDNGQGINWYGAKKYCEKYRGGGYTDWRLPTQDELAGLYDPTGMQKNNADAIPLHVTALISLSACCPWASETQGTQSVYFDFSDGSRWWFLTPGTRVNRAIPVRSVK